MRAIHGFGRVLNQVAQFANRRVKIGCEDRPSIPQKWRQIATGRTVQVDHWD